MAEFDDCLPNSINTAVTNPIQIPKFPIGYGITNNSNSSGYVQEPINTPLNLAFYSSSYREPTKNLRSLGGGPANLLINTNSMNSIFGNVEEYESSSRYIDYRVIYAVNISKSPIIIDSVVFQINPLLNNNLDKADSKTLENVNVNSFIPNYARKNYVHEEIFTTGLYRNGSVNIQEVVTAEQTQTNYGSRVFFRPDLRPGEFFPLLLQRVVTSPIGFVKNFALNFNFIYSVRPL